MPPTGFEPTISAGELPQTYALDHAATGTGNFSITDWMNMQPHDRTEFIKTYFNYFNKHDFSKAQQ
jgi:hypothetical protein